MTAVAVVAYCLIIFFVAWRNRAAEHEDDFLMGGRRAGPFQVGSSVFTLIGGGELVAMASLAFIFGWAALFLFLGYSLGFAVLAVLAKKLRAFEGAERAVSLPDFLYSHYGFSGSIPALILSFAAFFSLLMLQYGAGAEVLSSATGWSFLLSLVFIGAVVILYLSIGGFRAVLQTDVIQAIAMLSIVGLVIVLGVTGSQAASTVQELDRMSLGVAASLAVTGLIVALGSADVWQRLYAARSPAAARTGLLGAAVLFMVFGTVLVFVGIEANSLGLTTDPDAAFLAFFESGLPSWLTPLLVVLVLSAIMSTADTEVFLLSGLVLREADRLPGRSSDHGEVSRNSTAARLTVVVVGLAALGTAALFRDLVAVYLWLLNLPTVRHL